MTTTQHRLSPIAQRTRGALVAYLGPRLAQDQTLPKFASILSDVDGRNFEEKIPLIERRLRTATRGRLAQDADIEDLTDLLSALHEEGAGEGEDDEQPEIVDDPWPEAKDDGLVERLKEALAGQVPPEVMARIDEVVGEHENAENLDDDDAYDRRADDARRHLGRDETEEEMREREEKEGAEDARRRLGRDEHREEAEDRRRRAEDSRRRRMGRDRRRADDSKRRLGRDETPEEAEDRRMRHRAEDSRRAMDAIRRHADDWRKRAEDARRRAEDARKRAEDARHRAEDTKHADDRKRADDAKRHADDARRRAEDARRRAEDAKHRAEDARRRYGRDDPPNFPGKPNTGGEMTPMTKEAVDRMVEDRMKRAHDASIDTLRAVEYVRPWVGAFSPEQAMAFDSAATVYRRTLEALGVKDVGEWPADAMRAVIAAQPRPSQAGGTTTAARLGLDAAPSARSFGDRFAFTRSVVTE